MGHGGLSTEGSVRQHHLIAGEPKGIGGNDDGPSAYELVSAGLGACTAMTVQMYARRKKWPLEEIEVHLNHSKDYASDMAAADKIPPKLTASTGQSSSTATLHTTQKPSRHKIETLAP